MPLHMDEFKQPQLVGYVESVEPAKDYLLRNFLPYRQINDLDFMYDVFSGKYTRGASITGLEAGAPLRDKAGIDRAMGHLAKLQHSFRIGEREMFRFQQPRNQNEVAEIVNYVYDEVDSLVNGTYDTEEYLRAQVLYHGRIAWSEHDVQVEFEFPIPAGNKMTAATPWSSPEAEPLNDLRGMVKQFRKENNNQRPLVLHIDEETEADLLSNAQIKMQLRGESDNRLITTSDLQNVFQALGIPPYVVQDDMIDVFGTGAEALLPARRVVMLGNNLGFSGVGPTKEKGWQTGLYVVTKIQETNPPQEEVYVGETFFPALQRAQGIAWLDV